MGMLQQAWCARGAEFALDRCVQTTEDLAQLQNLSPVLDRRTAVPSMHCLEFTSTPELMKA
jgi:hypothetical protein